MKADLALKSEEVSKRYLVSGTRHTSIRELFTSGLHKLLRIESYLSEKPENPKEFWALKDVSFEVKQGERIAICGRNGAGKSTLLKLISRITRPTSGRVFVRGRVASLLEVGTGFHPELTGRENIYLNGAILGMTRAEIKKEFDAIVDFSEIGRFLDMPYKRYSSGMGARLGFAIAANLRSEVMIVDEVLAVGDAGFQKKCIDRMRELSQDQGRTILFVSHAVSSLKEFCKRGLVLDQGQVILDGDIDSAIERYEHLFSGPGPVVLEEKESGIHLAETKVHLEKSRLGSWRLSLKFFFEEDYRDCDVQVALFRSSHLAEPLVVSLAWPQSFDFSRGSTTLSIDIRHVQLNRGLYEVHFKIIDKDGQVLFSATPVANMEVNKLSYEAPLHALLTNEVLVSLQAEQK